MEIPFACSVLFSVLVLVALGGIAPAFGEPVDLSDAVVVVRPGELPAAERVAGVVLVEEVEKRTGLRWPVATAVPAQGTVVTVATAAALPPEAYRLRVDVDSGRSIVRIEGADGRGCLFGVGRFLRSMTWAKGRAGIARDLDVTSAPAYPIRGHQLGYRHTANSYDAWDEAQYDQYIRELAIFGCNAVENIPFQCSSSPVMPVPREEMNVKIAAICERYDMDHWVWTPAEFSLEDEARRAEELDKHEAFYRACPRLDAVFFPGGDPGNNPPELVMPFLRDLSERLRAHHPDAGMWISLQGFNPKRVHDFYTYLEEHKPAWLAGVVAGPSSPPIQATRNRLPRRYRLRHYPDITHTLLCQYPVPWWDPAFALTLGREPVNPQPRYYAHIHNWFAPATDGFITYSDGINDDVNKVVWSLRGWNPAMDVRQILVEYCRFFFGPDVAEEAADAILALETNWEGGLAWNGSVDATYAAWRSLAERAPELEGNWRWRLCRFRAAYDYFTRHRLLYETRLEHEANAVLAQAGTLGADAVMDAALEVLDQVERAPCLPEVRAALDADGEALFEQVGFQTSVERYHARNAERGAVLDFLDRPLNNRWWLEDEFGRVRALESEQAKVARLERIASWEDAAPGGFYDDVGNVAKSPHVVRAGSWMTDPDLVTTPNPDFNTWQDDGKSRLRLSWLSYMDWPKALVYEALDPKAEYVLRVTGRGDAIPMVDGEVLEAAVYGTAPGDLKEFPIARRLYEGGRLVVKWRRPAEGDINWRQASILTEVWLLKR